MPTDESQGDLFGKAAEAAATGRLEDGRWIEDMEARGQGELVEQTGQKTVMLPGEVYGDLGDLLPARVIGADPTDPLFNLWELPPGWRIEPTEHSMHSHLLDDLDWIRANIFYKAAYYDRRADMRIPDVLMTVAQQRAMYTWSDEMTTSEEKRLVPTVKVRDGELLNVSYRRGYIDKAPIECVVGFAKDGLVESVTKL